MTAYRRETFAIPESLDRDEYIIAKYTFAAETPDYIKFASRLAIEMSTGSWIPMPLETPELIRKHGAKVIDVFEVPDYEGVAPQGKRMLILEIAIPVVNIGYQIAMLLNTFLGAISYFGEIRLVELEFPKSFAQAFPGPRFGVEKLRQELGVPERPLLLTIIKPCTGLSPKQAGELFYQMAMGGADLIKDDEKMGNTSFSSVAERVSACMSAAKSVYEATGKMVRYAVNITDDPDQVMDNARAAIDAGGNMLMISHLTAGLGVLRKLAESPEITVPILVHPDMTGVLSRSEKVGVSSHLILGKLPRLCGADIVDVPSPYAAFPSVREKYMKIGISLQSPMYGMNKAWLQTGGAFQPGHVQAVVDDVGTDIVVGAGGSVHGHPMGATAGVKALRQAIDAVMAGRPLREAAKEYKELQVALDEWGVVGES